MTLSMRTYESSGEIPRTDDVERPPWLLVALVMGTMATSSLVAREPAPTDLLFMPMALVAILTARSLSLLPISPGAVIGSVLFAGCNLLAMLFAHDLMHSARFTAITFYMFGSAYCLAALCHRYGRSILMPMFIGFSIAAAASALIGILARYHVMPNWQQYMRDDSGVRIKSTFKDPNVFAPYLASAVLWTVANGLERKRFGLLRIGLVTLYLVGILFSFSRGAYLSLALSAAVLVALHVLVIRDARILARFSRTAILASIVIVPALVFALSKSSLGDYFLERLSLQGYDSERFGTQRYALGVAVDNPLGIGPGEWSAKRFDRAMHNLYLRVIVETGWLGLVTFLIAMGSSLLSMLGAVMARGRHSGTIAACIAVVVGTLGESIVIDTLHWRHLFLFLGIGLGLALRQSSRPDDRISV